MADDDISVVLADGAGTVVGLKGYDVGGGKRLPLSTPQVPEISIRSATASDHRFQVTAAAVKTLAAITGARFARVRVFHSTQSQSLRCYYVEDGTTPINDGSNAIGYLLHGEMMVVNLPDLTKYKLIGENGMTGQFEVYVEFVKW